MRFSLCSILLLIVNLVWAQKFVLEKSKVVFFSDAAIEDIRAENSKSLSIYNAETNEVAFSIPISEFQFENSTMREHFNEKYMDTDKFPKATFQGKFSPFNPAGKEQQPVTATGKLTIHGVTRDVEIVGSIIPAIQTFVARATFIVKLADYNIKIPTFLWQKIAEQVEVTVEFSYKPQ
ncbi:MAG: YceI family protein [Cyclobacteriaceae bacterium]|nr:YceI family protein [Cyclobacteriaceae bacterium]